MKIFKLLLIILLFGAGIALGSFVFEKKQDYQLTPNPQPQAITPSPLPVPISPVPSPQPQATTTPPLPKTFTLKVPFTPQAPTANWDEIHNEACEEASAIMAYFYFKGDTRATLPPEAVELEITKLVEWEKNTFSYFLDINTAETVRLLKEVYGLNAEIKYDFTQEDMKRELVNGKLVIFPINGQMLGNPNFRSPGPPYHMIVVKGFDQQGFITNDPGTRKGMNYPYTFETLYNANGDFNHSTHSVDLSQKMMIVVSK